MRRDEQTFTWYCYQGYKGVPLWDTPDPHSVAKAFPLIVALLVPSIVIVLLDLLAKINNNLAWSLRLRIEEEG